MQLHRLRNLPTMALAVAYAMPLLALFVLALMPNEGGVSHLLAHGMAGYISQSVLVAAGAGVLSLFMGGYTAWLVSRYEFPLRRVFAWALLLPLAVPSYIGALVYGYLLDAPGPLQTALRDATGLAWGEYWFPNIRSAGGAMVVLSLALYPYVFVLARVAFCFQCASIFETARLLGLPPRQWLWKVALPSARPALMMALALVMMESLADFGTVSLFGVNTVTAGIYKLWIGLNDPLGAARLAAMLMLVVSALIWLERHYRRRSDAMPHSDYAARSWQMKVGGVHALYKIIICALPVLFGFAVPVVQLIVWATMQPAAWFDDYHLRALGFSVAIGVSAAVLTMAVAMVFAYGLRVRGVRLRAALIRLAAMGYAIPGSVIAVAIFISLVALDKSIADMVEQATGERPTLWLTGSIFAMVLACSIRFMAVALSGVESGLRQISQSSDDAARLLGATWRYRFVQLHWPQLRMSVWLAAFMVFADTVKELPASMLLRPFQVDTLAIRTYELASDSRLQEASPPALMLIAICLAAVLWMGRQVMRAPSSSANDVMPAQGQVA